jgi:cytochrome c556
LIRSAQEHIDAAARGSFFTLSIEKARKLVEKMASNQSWNEERTQSRTRKVHQLEEVDMLTTKIDLLMKQLENLGLDHLKMVNARVMCEECREIGHMGINCPMIPQDVNFVGNSNNVFHPNQGFNVGWNKPSFPFDNHQQGGNGQNFNINEPSLKDIIGDQVRIIDEVGKKIHAMDKLLENINAKMDNFIVATQNQQSFNKMLETQIHQISAAIPCQSNGGSSKTPNQESVWSIFTMFKEKALKSTEGSLGGVGRGKKPSAAENISTKSSPRVKNATPAATSSPVTPAT